jgi:hypothetical protein
MSKGERNRIKVRVRTATNSAQLQGRNLGDRPPYGYRVADAGSHPSPLKAAGGQRLRAVRPSSKVSATRSTTCGLHHNLLISRQMHAYKWFQSWLHSSGDQLAGRKDQWHGRSV